MQQFLCGVHTSRSELELDGSVEDPEVADACSILLSDSLLSGQFGISAILHVQLTFSGSCKQRMKSSKLHSKNILLM